MARIWLHIGHGKTGTSTLQWTMNERSRQLGDICYPEEGQQSPQKAHHRLFPLKGSKYDPPIVRELRELGSRLDAESRPVFLSSEHLCYALRPKVMQIGRALQGHELRVLYYIRRQDDLIESSFRQRQAHRPGEWVDPQAFCERFVRGFDFDALIRPWREELGDKAVHVRLYHPEIIGRDVVSDAEHTLGLPPWLDRSPVPRNLSLTAAGTREIIRVAMEQGTECARILARELRGREVEGDNSPLFDTAARRAIMERYRAGNEAFASRYLDERSAALLLG